MVAKLLLLVWFGVLLSCNFLGIGSFRLPSAHRAWMRRTSVNKFVAFAKKPSANTPKESPTAPPVSAPPDSLPSADAPKTEFKSEFSRMVSLHQIPRTRPVSCRLIAKPEERTALSKRFELGEMHHLTANVTLYRKSETRIFIKGNISAHLTYTYDTEDNLTQYPFETTLLNNVDFDPESGKDKEKLEDTRDCDDEVPENGKIDVGEIVGQYLALSINLQ